MKSCGLTNDTYYQTVPNGCFELVEGDIKIWKAVKNNAILIFESFKDKIGWKDYFYIGSECTGKYINEWINNNYTLSIPSQEKLEHYLACKKAGKYVPKPEKKKWTAENIIGLTFNTVLTKVSLPNLTFKITGIVGNTVKCINSAGINCSNSPYTRINKY